MRELIEEIEKKVNTKEDLIFFLQEIDLANQLILTNINKNFSEILKGKIDPSLFSVLAKINRENEIEAKINKEEKRKNLLEKKKEEEKKLKIILKKERELEKKIKEIEKKERRAKNSKKEKELENERWKLEEERIKIEKEKWDLKENCKKIEEDLKKIKSQKEEKGFKQLIFFLELLRNHLTSLPEVYLEVAFDLPKEFILKINNWFEKQVRKKVILNLKTNPKLVGGIIIEHKGKIFDFSLIKEIKNSISKYYSA